MRFSVLIPAHNEEGCIASTVLAIAEALDARGTDYEILVVDDGSTDRTAEVLVGLQGSCPALRVVHNAGLHGYGFAVRRGLGEFDGDAVAIVMADASDRPEDLVRYIDTMEALGVDCVFGSRFIEGGGTSGYPAHKLVINRIANSFIRLLFGLRYNDITNAFKLYRREVIDGINPIRAHQFNLTVEIPLKAIVRGFSYAVVPCQWIGRSTGASKLKIREMGSRYVFIVLHCLKEKWFSRGNGRTTSSRDGSARDLTGAARRASVDDRAAKRTSTM